METYHKILLTVMLLCTAGLLAIAVTQPNGGLISTCHVNTEC